MFLSEEIKDKWQPVMEHAEIPAIQDATKRAITLRLLENQQIADFMIDSAVFWIDEYDFDGFRHDATKHIPLNFWRSLNKKVKLVSQKKGKYIYQIGETYGSHDLIKSYINSGELYVGVSFS